MFRAFLGGALLTFAAAVAVADVPTADKYIAEAKKKLAGNPSEYDRADARKKLDLAELELNGVAAEAKKSAADAIAAVRKEIATQEAAVHLKQWKRDLKRLLDDTDQAAGNLVTWPGVQGRFDEFARKPGVAETLGDELTEAKKRVASMGKLYAKNKQEETANAAEQLVKQLEARWAEKKADAAAVDRPEARSRAVEDVGRDIAQLTKDLKELPEDHATRRAVEPRVKKVADELRQVSASGAAGEVVRRLKDSWELDARETTGWEGEAADVTFERYATEQSPKMSAFGAPMTVELMTASARWLKNRKTDTAYQEVKDDPTVKVAFDVVKGGHDKALARMEAAAEAVVGQAEKMPITDQNRNAFERLAGDLRVSLGDSARSKPLQTRVQTLLDQRAVAAASEKTKGEWYAASTRQAAAKWSELKAKYSAGTGFDPTAGGANGKLFAVTTDNLMGYRFKPGDFPFATTINGHAVAAKYDPVVAGGIEEVQKKLGRALGDSDDDGKWEIVFRVEGTSGRLMARRQVEGDLTLNGNRVGTYRGEYSEPTDAAVVTIVAAKCGPLAVSGDAGVVTKTGDTQKVVGSDPKTQAGGGSGWAGYGVAGSLVRFVIGLSTAALCLLFAGWKPLAGVPAVAATFDRFAKPLGAVGAAAVLFGLYWLLGDLFRGFGGALTLLAAGGVVGLLALHKIGVVKAGLADRVRPFGAIVGFSCAAVTLVSLVTQGRLWVI